MSKSITIFPETNSFTKDVTNYWQQENSKIMKIIKFVGCFFAYFFALSLDATCKIGQLIYKKIEKPVKKNLYEKFYDFASKHLFKTFLGAAILFEAIQFRYMYIYAISCKQ